MDQDPPSMRIRCALCNKRVENWEGRFDPTKKAIVITVCCHGDRDEMVFPPDAAYDDGSYQDMRLMWQGELEGIAFLSKADPPATLSGP